MGVLFTKHKRIIKIIKGTREGIQKIYVCIIYIISGTKIHHELNELFIADWGPVIRRYNLLDSEVVLYGGVFQSFWVSAAGRPHHQAISAQAQEKGAIRSDL